MLLLARIDTKCFIFHLLWICSIVSITIATASTVTTKSTPVYADVLNEEPQQQHHRRRQLATLGIDSCACSPSFYEFTLDLSFNCDTDVTYGDGIVLTQCTILPSTTTDSNSSSNNSTDLTPTIITTINITELDQNLNIIQKDSIYVPLNSGDTFSYSSVTSNYVIWNDTADGDLKLLPRALQLTLLGINRNNIPIIFTGVIVYMDDCNIDSTILVNSTIGWVKLTKTTEALEEFCPFDNTNVNGTQTNIPSLSPNSGVTTVAPTLTQNISPTPNSIADVTTLPSISTIKTIEPTTTMMSSPPPTSLSLTLQPSSVPSSSTNVDSILPTPLLSSSPTTKIMSTTPTKSSSSSPFSSSTFNRSTKNPSSNQNTRPTNQVTPTLPPHSNGRPPNKNSNMNSGKSSGGGMSGSRAMGKGREKVEKYKEFVIPHDTSVSSENRNDDDHQQMTKPLDDYLPRLFKKSSPSKRAKKGNSNSNYGNGSGKGNNNDDPQSKQSPSSSLTLKKNKKDRPDQIAIKKKHPPALHSMPPKNADNNTILHFDDNMLEKNHAAGLSGNTGIDEGKSLMEQNYYNKTTTENNYLESHPTIPMLDDHGNANVLNSNSTSLTSMTSTTTIIPPISTSYQNIDNNRKQYNLYRAITMTSIGCSVTILLIIVIILLRQKHRAYIENQNNIRQEKAWNITQGLLL